jgi:hypothetical protein
MKKYRRQTAIVSMRLVRLRFGDISGLNSTCVHHRRIHRRHQAAEDIPMEILIES